MPERVWTFNVSASVDLIAEVKAESPRDALRQLAHQLQAALADIDPDNHRKVAFTEVYPPTLSSGRLLEVLYCRDDANNPVDATRYE